jgi:hypothetical protein
MSKVSVNRKFIYIDSLRTQLKPKSMKNLLIKKNNYFFLLINKITLLKENKKVFFNKFLSVSICAYYSRKN